MADASTSVPALASRGCVERERRPGLDRSTYAGFAEQVKETKRKLLELLIAAKRDGQDRRRLRRARQGQHALNYCGIRQDFIDFTVDRNPYKQGKFLPGTHIPIHPPEKIAEAQPDYVLILPWNFKDEIIKQMAHIHEWGGQVHRGNPRGNGSLSALAVAWS